MKTYKIYISTSVIATMALITSCEDFLEKIPQNNLSVDSYFKSENDYKLYTDGFYTAFNDWTGNMSGGSCFYDFRSDLIGYGASKSGNRRYPELSNATLMTAASRSASLYWDYTSIRSAYTLLDNIDNIELNATSKNLYMGTAYYLLAYRYFVMFRSYESVPIVRKVLEIAESDVASSPKEEVFAEALSHINKAIELLPSLGPTERERGRLTKLVALTLKTDMLLYTAGYYNEAMSGAKFSDAAIAAQAAVTEARNKGYGLSNDYNSLFIADEQSGAEPQKEIIFEYVRLKDVATHNFSFYGWGPHVPISNLGWGDFSTTQECVDMYECTDGLPISKSKLYTPEKPWDNRDPRFGLTTLYPGSLCTTTDGQKWRYNSLNEYAYDSDGNLTNILNVNYVKETVNAIDVSPTGYINIKYWDRYNGSGGGYTSFIIYRFGELLLMYAEALLESGGSTDEIRSALTELRARVGMPAVTIATNPTTESLRALIRNERVVELLGEDKRYWDLKRWHLFEERLNIKQYSMYITKTFNPDGTPATYLDKLTVPVSVDGAKTVEFEIPNGANGGEVVNTLNFPGGKYWVWPIPETAINASTTKALKQNPLWQ
ncbi:MAG: RagB/SusD family nutrient uptake outer membrane protein [Tannerella sp.]|jgi:tetratricopeptide (TPR) repeat protein|nr:RagB/SusD family nutrient uptake outer membrane protein [Tannerella sp.]